MADLIEHAVAGNFGATELPGGSDATTSTLPPDLRGEGRRFADDQTCSPDRPIADRLAAFLGRTV